MCGQSIGVESELVLGREEPDPGHLGGDSRLSRRHARISVDEQGRAVVEDLGSTNGTWVNEERLSAPHLCVTGDVLRVGHSTFELEVAPPPAAQTEPEIPVPRSAPTVAEMPAPVPLLLVTTGARQGEEIPLDQELLIGRSYGEPGALGGDRRLSRRHARVARGPGGVFFIEDTGSANGTRVNGTPVLRPRALREADEIEIGSSTLVAHGLPAVPVGVETADATPMAPPPPPPGVVRVPPLPRPPSASPQPPSPGRAPQPPPAPAGAVHPPQPPPAPAGAGHPPPPPPAPAGAGHPPPPPPAPAGAGHPPPPPPAPAGAGHPPPPPPAPAGAVHPPQPPLAPARAAASLPPQPPDQFLPRGAAGTRLSSRRGGVVGLFGAIFVASVALAVAAVLLAAPLGSRTCPGGFVCNPPPTTPPLHATASFTGSLGWSVEYDPKSAHPSVANASRNELVLQETSSYDQHSLGVPPDSNFIGVFVRAYRSGATSPTAAKKSLVNEMTGHLIGTDTAPASDQLFTRPALGFHPAVGEVLEGNTQTPQGPGSLVKVAVMSAASGGVTLAVGIIYTLRRGENQSDNPNRVPDAFGDEIFGTVRFPGDGAA